MSDAARSRPPATVADFLAIPEERRFHELIAGEIVEKSAPSGAHGATQLLIGATLLGSFGRSPSGDAPGGWWFATEVEIRFGGEICRPDVVGWRRSLVPDRPRGTIVDVVPQWVCEVLSENKRNDLVRKKHIYHHEHVEHYWVADPEQGTLAVYRWHSEGYLEVLSAQRGERVRAEPFEAIEISVTALFGDDRTDED